MLELKWVIILCVACSIALCFAYRKIREVEHSNLERKRQYQSRHLDTLALTESTKQTTLPISTTDRNNIVSHSAFGEVLDAADTKNGVIAAKTTTSISKSTKSLMMLPMSFTMRFMKRIIYYVST